MDRTCELSKGDWVAFLLGQGEVMRRTVIVLLFGCVWLVFWDHAAAVTLQWNASARATRYRLYYGLRSLDYDTVLETGAATSAVVSGLTPGATYFFAATALNAAGESGFSNEVHAVIPPGDTIPPTVTITSPAPGRVPPRQLIPIIAEASDQGGVVSVSIHVDGMLLCARGQAPYTCPWRVPAPPRRTYSLQAKAIDAANNQGVSPLVEVIAE
jgi:hypothetical protein